MRATPSILRFLLMDLYQYGVEPEKIWKRINDAFSPILKLLEAVQRKGDIKIKRGNGESC